MSEAAALALADALPWVAFWAFLGLCVLVAHKQHMAGYDTPFFGFNGPEEERLREAIIRKAEMEAAIAAPEDEEVL